MESQKFKEAELLVELIRIGQEGSVRPDNGRAGSDGACNNTGIVRDAGYCKPHLENIWKLLGSNEYFDFTAQGYVQNLDSRTTTRTY